MKFIFYTLEGNVRKTSKFVKFCVGKKRKIKKICSYSSWIIRIVNQAEMEQEQKEKNLNTNVVENGSPSSQHAKRSRGKNIEHKAEMIKQQQQQQ